MTAFVFGAGWLAFMAFGFLAIYQRLCARPRYDMPASRAIGWRILLTWFALVLISAFITAMDPAFLGDYPIEPMTLQRSGPPWFDAGKP
jgi:hypothetical protein